MEIGQESGQRRITVILAIFGLLAYSHMVPLVTDILSRYFPGS